MSWILARLSEGSTKAGLASLLALLGLTLTPEQYQAVWALLLAGLQLWQVFRKETK